MKEIKFMFRFRRDFIGAESIIETYIFSLEELLRREVQEYIQNLLGVATLLSCDESIGLRDRNGNEIFFDCSIITDGIIITVVNWDSWRLLDDIQNGYGKWEIIGSLHELLEKD